jgi:hypothetical protein
MTHQIKQIIKQINLVDANFSEIPIEEIVNHVITAMNAELYLTSVSDIPQISYRLECDDDKESPIFWNAGIPHHCHLSLPTILYLRARQTV